MTKYADQKMVARGGSFLVNMTTTPKTEMYFQAVKAGVTNGHYFSVAPSILRDPDQRRVALSVPRDRIVLESDSPALGPVKGQRNTPLNLLKTVEVLSELWDVSAEQVAEITTTNALRLFPKLKRFVKF